MKNKKILGVIFLFFIVLLSSVVYAQIPFSGTPISFLIINTIVIALALFILQAVILTDMKPEQKTGIWFAILIIAVVISWLYGRAGYIWQVGSLSGFFNLKVLLNTAILSAIGYFLLQFTPGGKIESKPGQTGAIILIIILSGIMSFNLTYDENTGEAQYIWNTTIGSFFFGDEGIFTSAKRIGVFITVSILFSWGFNVFIQKSEGGGEKLNYALAILIAANLAHDKDPISVSTLITFGQIILTFVIYKGIQPTINFDKFKGVGFAISLLIAIIFAGWISGMIQDAMGIEQSERLFPPEEEKGRASIPTSADQPWYKTVFGYFGTLGEWAVSLGKWIFSFLLPWNWIWVGGLIALFFWSKSKEGEFHKSVTSMRKDAWLHTWNAARHFIRSGPVTINWLARLIRMRDRGRPDEIHPWFNRLRVEIQILMDYMLRLEVFTFKIAAVENFKTQIKKEISPEFKQKWTREQFLQSIKNYKIGPEIIEDDGKFKLDGGPPGWTNSAWLICRVFNGFKDWIETSDLSSEPEESAEKTASHQADNLRVSLKPTKGNLNTSFTKFKGYNTKLNLYYLLNHIKLRFLDQYNLTGIYSHSYRFGNPEARFSLCEYEVVEKMNMVKGGSPILITEKKEAEETNEKLGEDETGHYFEIDDEGYVLKDINAIEMRHPGAPSKIRKIDPFDIIDAQNNEKIFEDSQTEWEYFIEDIIHGKYHPESRSAENYNVMHRKGYTRYSNVKRNFDEEISRGNPAFDREALKDHGTFRYWGRKNWFDDTDESINQPPFNPFPGVSVDGSTSYIKELTKELIKDPKLREENLQRYVYYDEKKMFTRLQEEKSS